MPEKGPIILDTFSYLLVNEITNYSSFILQWHSMRSMQQDDSAAARQAGLRVSRLRAALPQALPRQGAGQLSQLHRAQYGAVSYYNTITI